MAMPHHVNPCWGVMKFTIFVDLFLVIITIYLVCMNHATKYRKIFFKKYINSTLFTPKSPPLMLGGQEIYNSLTIYPIDATY